MMTRLFVVTSSSGREGVGVESMSDNASVVTDGDKASDEDGHRERMRQLDKRIKCMI